MKKITIEQAAEMLNVSKATIRRRIKNGDIKAELLPTKYGEQYFIAIEQFNAAFAVEEVMPLPAQISVDDFKRLMQMVMQPLQDEIAMLRKQLEKKNKKGYIRSWKK